MNIWVAFLLILVLLALNAFFVASEFALVSSRRCLLYTSDAADDVYQV